MAVIPARGINIDVDADGDIRVSMPHAGCSCCQTAGFISAAAAGELAERLKFAIAEAAARKAQPFRVAEEAQA